MSNLCKEEWRPVVGFEGFYEVSNYGRVMRTGWTINNREGKILSPAYSGKGYPAQRLCSNGVHKSKRIHRMVAEAFVENPENKPLVNHKNGIKTDNFYENLEWVTSSENSIHKIYVLGKGIGSTNSKHKFTDWNVLKIKKLLKDGITHKQIARTFKTSKSAITAINTGRTWGHLVEAT